MTKLFSILVCMIVCFAASQALAAYDFTGKSNAKMLKDMRAWTVAEWDENIRALINTGDVALIKRTLAVAEKAISTTTAPGVTTDLIVKILGNNNALLIEHIGSGIRLSLATDPTAAGPVDIRDTIPTDTINEEEEWVSGKARK
ncbi:MAG: hypothetical protein IKR81_06150 [Victivallales bacterium]|nr:hypothetical protein [Victivallales bacterium]